MGNTVVKEFKKTLKLILSILKTTQIKGNKSIVITIIKNKYINSFSFIFTAIFLRNGSITKNDI